MCWLDVGRVGDGAPQGAGRGVADEHRWHGRWRRQRYDRLADRVGESGRLAGDEQSQELERGVGPWPRCVWSTPTAGHRGASGKPPEPMPRMARSSVRCWRVAICARPRRRAAATGRGPEPEAAPLGRGGRTRARRCCPAPGAVADERLGRPHRLETFHVTSSGHRDVQRSPHRSVHGPRASSTAGTLTPILIPFMTVPFGGRQRSRGRRPSSPPFLFAGWSRRISSRQPMSVASRIRGHGADLWLRSSGAAKASTPLSVDCGQASAIPASLRRWPPRWVEVGEVVNGDPDMGLHRRGQRRVSSVSEVTRDSFAGLRT
jgi:hypothetical protein